MGRNVQPSRHDLGRDDSHYGMRLWQGRSRLFRVGVPLVATISALLLGWWYMLFATKPSVTTQAVESKATTQQDDRKEASAPLEQDSSSIDTSLQITQSGNVGGPAETELKINSVPVAIPENGSVHRVIHDDDATTTLDISVDSQANGSSQTQTSTNVQINSHSEIEADTEDNKGP